ncbi:CDP-alcohol phosphatidyltransferase family protein [Natrialbaceae archaeon A-arb3/5]
MSSPSVRPIRTEVFSRWYSGVFGLLVLTTLVVLALEFVWTDGPTAAFLAVVSLAVLAESALVWSLVDRASSGSHTPQFTLATWVTVSRGAAVAVLAGFLVSPTVTGHAVWIPVVLFVAAAALDAVDGAIARATGTATDLGARLDTEMDGLVVFVGSVLAVSAGSAPIILLLAGSARYLFVAGTWWRTRRGSSVNDLPPNRFRRPLGALLMLAIWLALVPTPGSTTSSVIVMIVVIPFLANFYWDWRAVTGRRTSIAGQ